MDMGTGYAVSNFSQGGFSGPSLALLIGTEQKGSWGLAAARKDSGLAQGLSPPFAFCLAQVRSKRCDVKTKFVTHSPCTTCAAVRKQLCPSGWLRTFPEKTLVDCRYGPTGFRECGGGPGGTSLTSSWEQRIINPHPWVPGGLLGTYGLGLLGRRGERRAGDQIPGIQCEEGGQEGHRGPPPPLPPLS